MSEATYASMRAAIEAHLSDENEGAITVAWHVVIHGMSSTADNTSHYQYACSSSPPHSIIGLLDMSMTRMRSTYPPTYEVPGDGQ